MSDTKKAAHIADQFLSAVGVIMPECAVGEKIHDAMTERESMKVGMSSLNLLGDMLDGTTNAKVEAKTIRLGEMFAKVAVRIAAEDDAAKLIKRDATDDQTVIDLEQAGAPNLAKLVKIARAAK